MSPAQEEFTLLAAAFPEGWPVILMRAENPRADLRRAVTAHIEHNHKARMAGEVDGAGDTQYRYTVVTEAGPGLVGRLLVTWNLSTPESSRERTVSISFSDPRAVEVLIAFAFGAPIALTLEDFEPTRDGAWLFERAVTVVPADLDDNGIPLRRDHFFEIATVVMLASSFSGPPCIGGTAVIEAVQRGTHDLPEMLGAPLMEIAVGDLPWIADTVRQSGLLPGMDDEPELWWWDHALIEEMITRLGQLRELPEDEQLAARRSVVEGRPGLIIACSVGTIIAVTPRGAGTTKRGYNTFARIGEQLLEPTRRYSDDEELEGLPEMVCGILSLDRSAICTAVTETDGVIALRMVGGAQ